MIINQEPRIEVYDSGCTKHNTLYRNAITDFTKIPPKSFQAVNKQSFKVIGAGEMTIDILNSAKILQLKLTDVLYSPEIGYTLVSIGHLDDSGYSISFSDGKCVIKDSSGENIGIILKNCNGLYKVTHEEDKCDIAQEVLTLDQFHR